MQNEEEIANALARTYGQIHTSASDESERNTT